MLFTGSFTARDCNPRLVFPIPGFGIENIGIAISIYSARTAVYEVKFSSVELMCCERTAVTGVQVCCRVSWSERRVAELPWRSSRRRRQGRRESGWLTAAARDDVCCLRTAARPTRTATCRRWRRRTRTWRASSFRSFSTYCAATPSARASWRRPTTGEAKHHRSSSSSSSSSCRANQRRRRRRRLSQLLLRVGRPANPAEVRPQPPPPVSLGAKPPSEFFS